MNLISFSFCYLVALYLTSVIAAAPPPFFNNPTPFTPYNNVVVLKYANDNHGFGNYKYAYELSDGSRAEQVGEIRNQGTQADVLAVSGQFRWVSPEGVAFTVRYTADEAGYKPEIEQDFFTFRQYPFSPTSQGQGQQGGYYQGQTQTEYHDTPHYVASLIG